MMHATLLQPEHWAQQEFSSAEFGDVRLADRLVSVGSALAQSGSGTLPQAFAHGRDLKAAYRFFSNDKVSYDKIMAPHWQRTRRSCLEPGEYLWIEDSSDLDYSSHRHCQGLGQIGNEHGRGLMLHTTLAVRVNAWDLNQCPEVEVVGIAGQKCWAREGPSRRKTKEHWRQRLKRTRESQRWTEIFSQMPPCPAGVSIIHVRDRESDIYEAFEEPLQQGYDFIIRAQHDRTLTEEELSAFEAVAQAPVLGHFELEVRERPERQGRTAKIELRAVGVTLKGPWRPGGTRPPVKVNVVQAREVDPPAGEKPICWILFTSLPAERFVEVRRIVARYAKRWLIEEFHKALKSGTRIEDSELETADRLKALTAVLVIAAVRLLNTKLLARTHPDQKVDVESFGPEAIEVLTARYGKSQGGWTYGTLIVAIARLGGFLARRGDGSPGWLTIWRGWKKLMHMVDGILTLKNNNTGSKRCG
jgi:hypothetical protein